MCLLLLSFKILNFRGLKVLSSLKTNDSVGYMIMLVVWEFHVYPLVNLSEIVACEVNEREPVLIT